MSSPPKKLMVPEYKGVYKNWHQWMGIQLGCKQAWKCFACSQPLECIPAITNSVSFDLIYILFSLLEFCFFLMQNIDTQTFARFNVKVAKHEVNCVTFSSLIQISFLLFLLKTFFWFPYWFLIILSPQFLHKDGTKTLQTCLVIPWYDITSENVIALKLIPLENELSAKILPK